MVSDADIVHFIQGEPVGAANCCTPTVVITIIVTVAVTAAIAIAAAVAMAAAVMVMAITVWLWIRLGINNRLAVRTESVVCDAIKVCITDALACDERVVVTKGWKAANVTSCDLEARAGSLIEFLRFRVTELRPTHMHSWNKWPSTPLLGIQVKCRNTH